MDLFGGDRAVVALVDREDQVELAEVGFHGGHHVRVLELAGKLPAVMADRLVDLSKRGGGGGGALEAGEPLLPVRPQLRRHPALDEGPAHAGRVGLKLGEFLDVFLRQSVGDGGQDLRHLHQRPFQPAKRVPQFLRVLAAFEFETEIALTGEPRRQPAHRRGNPCIAGDPPAKRVLFSAICHGVKVVLQAAIDQCGRSVSGHGRRAGHGVGLLRRAAGVAPPSAAPSPHPGRQAAVGRTGCGCRGG